MKKLIIIGAGGHGRVVADIAQKLNTYESIEFLDDRDITENMGFPVVGKTADVNKYIAIADIFIAVGDGVIRKKLIEVLLEAGATIPVIIHPNAVVGTSVEIGLGTAVMAGAVINPCAKIGKGVIVNTGACIDHDCVIGDYAHISVGARVAGTVSIGSQTWLGVGSCVRNNITICENCMIGSGAVVVKDIMQRGTYIGVPARKMD